MQGTINTTFNTSINTTISDTVNSRPIDSSTQINYSEILSSFEENDIPINVRILNFPTISTIKQLKSQAYDHFVSIAGTVVRVSNVQPYCVRMAFKCEKCSSEFVSFICILKTIIICEF